MGYYSGRIKMEFEGTSSEKKMMERLLTLMDTEDVIEWNLPLDEQFEVYPLTALLGTMQKNDEGGYSLTFGDLDPLSAPKLFAALFPASQFRYSIELEYSVSYEDTPQITAVYENKTLMIRDAYLYSSSPSDKEKVGKICKKVIGTDPDANAKYEQYREENEIEDDEEVNWYDLLGELVDNPTETMVSLYKFKKTKPSRNKKYEKSFFDEGDLQEYLVSEQIKEQEMSLTEYIKAFPFTKEQFQHFIKVAADSHFAKMTAFLLAEQQLRFEQ